MSEVISFRLDRNNPRESLALHLLEQWREEGYPLRQIFTEALLRYANPTSLNLETGIIYEVNAKLSSIEHMLRGGDYPVASTPKDSSTYDQENSLSDAFVAAIRKAAKPGITEG